MLLYCQLNRNDFVNNEKWNMINIEEIHASCLLQDSYEVRLFLCIVAYTLFTWIYVASCLVKNFGIIDKVILKLVSHY